MEEEYQDLFTKVVLMKSDRDFRALIGKPVTVAIDAAYTIGKSIAVLYDGEVIGHLTKRAVRPVWIQLRFDGKVHTDIYDKLDNGFQNTVSYSTLSYSEEIGIRVRVFFSDSFDGKHHFSGNNDAKRFLAFLLNYSIYSFPGVTMSNCPSSIKHLAFPACLRS
jgi:hypothetical protein